MFGAPCARNSPANMLRKTEMITVLTDTLTSCANAVLTIQKLSLPASSGGSLGRLAMIWMVSLSLSLYLETGRGCCVCKAERVVRLVAHTTNKRRLFKGRQVRN